MGNLYRRGDGRLTLGKVVLVLIGIWILMGLVGILIKGLFFLFVIALIAFGFTLAGGAKRGGFNRR